MQKRLGILAIGLGVSFVWYANAAQIDATSRHDHRPQWLKIYSVRHTDGISDDLLTAGLGKAIWLGEAPGYQDAAHPTVNELRRNALYAKQDPRQGWGRLYGPTLIDGRMVADAERVAGDEVLAYSDDQQGFATAAMLLHIPKNFSWQSPCILAVPASGSSRLYQDVPRVGGWGLHRGCAVVYTDKGQGNGWHDLATNRVQLIDGRVVSSFMAGQEAHFRAPLHAAERAKYLSHYPDRLAFKHAHSRLNPDATWGRDVLRSIEFAFWWINRSRPERAKRLSYVNTLVIVTGNSNGGGAALLAGEADHAGIIDGIVAAQPQVQPRASGLVNIERAGREWRGGGRSLIDYFSQAILYQPCAVLATPNAPFATEIAYAAQRCQSLSEQGLIKANKPVEQAREALAKLHALGWEPEADDQQAFSFRVAPTATLLKYITALGRFGVEDHLCNYSIAAHDASSFRPRATTDKELATLFVDAGGGPPVGSIDLINDADPRGPHWDTESVSARSGRKDYNLDGARCLRRLAAGHSYEAYRVRQGNNEFRATGNLHGIPTLVLHGRTDARVPPMFSSRPYLGLNSLVEGLKSRLSYIEIDNVGHFGASPPFDSHYLPLTYYEEQALDQMWAHLTQGRPLPPSQFVRTKSRGGVSGSAPDTTLANLAPMQLMPVAEDRISVRRGKVTIPD
ncbi:D-(-)-3-hydroxybutyrate oligomer hydrolase (plasmid) [Pseudomonas luteola]|uniref:3-hydroxybutyrate oligomer hydrolase family protein n=1 Tax=Pseudomonas luteola TaxID=47886 RepID=UPI00388D4B0D